jgi:hypothetical protein
MILTQITGYADMWHAKRGAVHVFTNITPIEVDINSQSMDNPVKTYILHLLLDIPNSN